MAGIEARFAEGGEKHMKYIDWLYMDFIDSGLYRIMPDAPAAAERADELLSGEDVQLAVSASIGAHERQGFVNGFICAMRIAAECGAFTA